MGNVVGILCLSLAAHNTPVKKFNFCNRFLPANSNPVKKLKKRRFGNVGTIVAKIGVKIDPFVGRVETPLEDSNLPTFWIWRLISGCVSNIL